MSPFAETLMGGAPMIEHVLRQLVQEHATGFCGDMLEEHLGTGGKRIRAKMTLQLAELFGVTVENSLQWAIAVEMLHNATLIHDDVQDGDTTRRNQPTCWVNHGIPQAINAGDLGLMLPYQCIEKMTIPDAVRWKLSQTLSKHSIATVCGQSLEMTLLPQRDFTLASYTRAALGKTGAFFGLPVEGLAYMIGMENSHREELVHLYSKMGLLFQMQDDILDCFGDKGRMRGADLCEGKVSLLVVEHLQLYPEEQSEFVQLLESETSLEHDVVARYIKAFADRGALELALQEVSLLEHHLCTAPILDAYPNQKRLVTNLLDKIMDPIQHLFHRPAEMAQ